MTLRNPAVMVNGVLQGLQVGDTIPGGAAVVTMTTVEVTFATVTEEAEFSVTDAAITAASKIMVLPSGIAATSRDADEAAMEAFYAVAIPRAGAFTLLVRALRGPVIGAYKFNYLVGT